MTAVVKRSTEAYELYEGDQITVGITHEVRVGRESSWVKYEAKTRVRPNETEVDTRTRAIGHVNVGVMEAVHTAVETVRKAT